MTQIITQTPAPTITMTTTGLKLQTIDEMYRFGKCAMMANVLGGSRGDQGVAEAVVKIQAGAELGMQPMESIRAFHVIEGKTALSAGAMAARIKQSMVYDYRVVQFDEKACEIIVSYRDTDLAPVRYTIEDAQRAGTAHRATWKKFPRNMLFARCISEAARVHCPHLLGTGTLYTPDELQSDEPLQAEATVSQSFGSEEPTPAPVDMEEAHRTPDEPEDRSPTLVADGLDGDEIIDLSEAVEEEGIRKPTEKMWARAKSLAYDERLPTEYRERLHAIAEMRSRATHGGLGRAIGICKKYIEEQTGEPYSDPTEAAENENQPCDGESSANAG